MYNIIDENGNHIRSITLKEYAIIDKIIYIGELYKSGRYARSDMELSELDDMIDDYKRDK